MADADLSERTLILGLGDDALDHLADLLTDRLRERIQDERTPWMNGKQAAEYLGCSPERIRKLVMLEELPRMKDGRRNLFRREDLDAFALRGGAKTP